jgi:hypothetical protein
VFFLKEPLTAIEAVQTIVTKEGVDQAFAGDGVLYFSRLVARLTSSYASASPLCRSKSMTIRNWNTTTKLLQLMEAARGRGRARFGSSESWLPTMSAASFSRGSRALARRSRSKPMSRQLRAADGEQHEANRFLGVRMGQVFALAKEFKIWCPTKLKSCWRATVHEAQWVR